MDPPLHYRIREHRPQIKRYGFALDYFAAYTNHSARLHSVDVALMTFIVSGRGWHLIDADRFQASGGTVGITHYGQQHTLATRDLPLRLYNLYLDPQSVPLPPLPSQFEATAASILPLHRALRQPLNRHIHIRLAQPEWAEQLLKQLHKELWENETVNEAVARQLLILLMVECCRSHQNFSQAPAQAARNQDWLQRLCAHIESNVTGKLSLSGLGKQSGLNPSYLSRSFHEQTGRRLRQYINERKIAAALMKLQSGKRKILEVAYECGFEDLSHFNRTFKQIMSMSPGQYRRQNQAGTEDA